MLSQDATIDLLIIAHRLDSFPRRSWILTILFPSSTVGGFTGSLEAWNGRQPSPRSWLHCMVGRRVAKRKASISDSDRLWRPYQIDDNV